MTILIVPHMRCNLRCRYCFADGYQTVDAPRFSLKSVLAQIDEYAKAYRGESFCLHGGEATLTERGDLEALLSKMYEVSKCGSIQTNLYELDADLIRMFKRYNIHVGVSLDGDGDLNSLRGGFACEAENLQYTEQVFANLQRLHEAGVSCGVITVLTTANAGTPEKLERLFKFILRLQSVGVTGGRLNLMWTNRPELKQYQLTAEQATNAYLTLYRLLKLYPKLSWNPFREFVDNLLGFGHSSCGYGKCDYFCTYGAKVILPDGSLGNCDRTHQEGAIYTRAEQPTYERYEALKQTDCSGCRYWNVCYGGCPAEGKDGDWRNKTRFCSAIQALYEAIELDIRGLLPNVQLITEWQGEKDYFDAYCGGFREWQPFKKMTHGAGFSPSSWRCINLPENKTPTHDYYKPVVKDGVQYNHGDHTNHTGGKQP